MSAELIPVSMGPNFMGQIQEFTRDMCVGLGRIAASGLLVIGGGIATFCAESAAQPTVAEAAACSGTHCDAQGTVELSGSDWLGGNGVDIYANNGSAAYDSGVNNYFTKSDGTKVLTGEEWQCVELVNRLYMSEGWITSTWKGNGNSLVDKDNLPSGLKFEAQGSIDSIKPGDAITLDDGDYGHVGIVNSYDSSTGKVDIVNQNTTAVHSSATLKDKKLTMSGWSGYSVQGIVEPNSTASSIPSPSPNNTVLRLLNREQPDGVNATYWTKSGSAFESWYRADGSGVHTTDLVDISQGDIKDIDEQDNSDGEHLLYTATTHDVRETWWYAGQGPHTSNPPIIHDDANIRKIEKTVGPDGAQQLYVMTDGGVDEYWWFPGGNGIHKNRIYTLANPVAMQKEVEPDGTQELYVADHSYVYENWWRSGEDPHTGIPVMNIPQADINSLDFSEDSDGTHRVYAGRDHDGVWEASWKPGQTGPIATWQVTGDQGVRAIRKYNDNGTPVMYVATQGGVFEYWWPAGTHDVHGSTVTQQPDIHDIARTTTPTGAQAVDTATGTNITETYWFPGGDGPHTGRLE